MPSGKLSLSFKDPAQPLRDILDSVRMIEDFTSEPAFEQFRDDPKTVAAVKVRGQAQRTVSPGTSRRCLAFPVAQAVVPPIT